MHHVYQLSEEGLHVVTRSDPYWADLLQYLVIEQVLMRSLKTTGGLTRGRGMTEIQRLVWLLSITVCSEMNLAMQEPTSVSNMTSEQHKDVSNAKMEKDILIRIVWLPPALFQNKCTPRLANKATLGDALWKLMPYIIVPPGDCQYILDGGAFLHRAPWNNGSTL